MRFDDVRKVQVGRSWLGFLPLLLLVILPGRPVSRLELEQLYHRTTSQEQQSRKLVKREHLQY